MSKPAEPRRAVSMKLQRDLALAQLADAMRALGLIPVDASPEFELDHDPALCLRPVDPETGKHIPPQHEPSCLIWRTKEAHDRKTNGPGGERRITTLGSDKHTKSRVDRLSEAHAETQRKLLSIEPKVPKPPGKIRSARFAPPKDKRRPATDPLAKSLPRRRSLYGEA